MRRKRRINPRKDALAALDARIKELTVRLDWAKLAKDAEKIESIERKMSRAMGQASRVRRKMRIENGGR